MKQRLIAFLLALCLCAGLVPMSFAAGATMENSVNVDQLVAHGKQMFLALEGNYDSVTPKDSNSCSIGFMQWHGMNALKLLKRICAAAPAFSRQTLGEELYEEVQTKEVVYSTVNGWKERVLNSEEAARVKALIGSEVGRQCQDELARIDIVEICKSGWSRGVRTEPALLYYISIENQYGIGGSKNIMSYIREALGISSSDTINSLAQFHAGVLKAAETYSSVRNYLNGRLKVYNFLTGTLGLDPGEVDAPVEETMPFTDIPEHDDWAYDAIVWAYNHKPQITSGTSATTFTPDATLTRAEAMTFLWAAAGKPSPSSSYNPFKDVKPGDYYYKAVLWAVEKGYTSGTSATTFSPKDTVTRGQMLTFLWAFAGKPKALNAANPFKDVGKDDYYRKAAVWAYYGGILVGNEGDGTMLYPKQGCSRAYVVTYLYDLFVMTAP